MTRLELKKLLADAIRACYATAPIFDYSVEAPENHAHGDYASNAALTLAKIVKKNPREVAETLVADLRNRREGARIEIEIAPPGFINFFIEERALVRSLRELLKNPDAAGSSAIGEGKVVMVEYFQLNIAKRPHIGHIRSAIIGDALKRMLLAFGYRAVSDTHVGDWGTQFGILLWAFKNLVREDDKIAYKEYPFENLEKLYGAANLQILQKPELRESGKAEFAKLEQGDAENRKIWEWMVEVSMHKLLEAADRLGLLPFDEHRGESFYEDKMAPMVRLALEKNVAKKTEEGAVIVDLTAEGLDEAVLVKSDGASTYLLRDLATIHYRKQQWNFWKNLYVVDARQSHHFRQVFRVATLLGLEGAGESEHVEYGFMKLPEGTISTRAGTVVALEDVVREAEVLAAGVIREKNPGLPDAPAIARSVGLGALKYFDLSHHRKSDIVFRWESALSFEGNTGPYLQYTHARLKSILRKCGGGAAYRVDPDARGEAVERSLLVTLLRFPEAIEDALEVWSPHILAAYLYQLARQINGFYHAYPVAQETDEIKRGLRIALVAAAAIILKKGLYLLGIDSPEEM